MSCVLDMLCTGLVVNSLLSFFQSFRCFLVLAFSSSFSAATLSTDRLLSKLLFFLSSSTGEFFSRLNITFLIKSKHGCFLLTAFLCFLLHSFLIIFSSHGKTGGNILFYFFIYDCEVILTIIYDCLNIV